MMALGSLLLNFAALKVLYSDWRIRYGWKRQLWNNI